MKHCPPSPRKVSDPLLAMRNGSVCAMYESYAARPEIG